MSNYQHERGWLDSPVWGDVPYSEREAWSWMLGEANWKDSMKNINGHPVEIKRGQFTSSLRFMAQRFQWSVGRVQRFLKKLRAWDMIKTDTANDTAQNVITICNYNKYQNKSGKVDTETDTVMDTAIDTATDTGAIQQRIQTRNPSNQSNQSNQLIYTPLPPKGEKSDLEKPKRKRSEKKQVEKPECVPQQIWDDFLEIRKTKKAPLTQTAWNGIVNQSRKAGLPIESALEICCQRGWAGFNADWIIDQKTTKGTTNGKRTSHDELREFLDESRNGGFVRDAHLRLR